VAPTWAALARRFGDELPAESYPPRAVWLLGDAGYAGYRRDSGDYLVFDSGPIGPDHQPGHGHADALSFELSHRGRRIVTDTGVFTYAAGRTRQHDRGTAAHNTIEIDGRDQSELWASFRCGRRTSRHWIRAEQGRGGATFSGGYRGPGRGVRSVSHRREIFAGRDVVGFTDRVAAAGQRSASVRLHFAPGLRLRQIGRRWRVEEQGSGRSVACLLGEHLDWRQSETPYHPEFGREEPRACLTAAVPFRDRLTLKWWLILR
jgi:hypothetical protein